MEGVRGQSKLAGINLAVLALFVLEQTEPRLGQKRTRAGFCSLRYLRHSSGLLARPRGASSPCAGGCIAPFGQSREQCAEGAPTRGAENAGPRPGCPARLTLWTIRERQGGDINLEFRMKRADGGGQAPADAHASALRRPDHGAAANSEGAFAGGQARTAAVPCAQQKTAGVASGFPWRVGSATLKVQLKAKLHTCCRACRSLGREDRSARSICD